MCENPKALGIFFEKLFEASGLDTNIVLRLSDKGFVLDLSGC